MRFRSLWLLLPLLMVPLLMLAAGDGDATRGKAVFSRCSVCHGDAGEGKDMIARAYGVTMRHLGSSEVQSMDDAAIKKIITSGKGKMKPVSLTDAEINDVLAFMRNLKRPFPKKQI